MPLTFTPEEAKGLSDFLTPIVVFEVGQGIRSDTYSPERDDFIDRTYKRARLASVQKGDSTIQISEAGLVEMTEHYNQYEAVREVPFEKELEYVAWLNFVRDKLRKAQGGQIGLETITPTNDNPYRQDNLEFAQDKVK